ncbi:hypothetical protein NP233_g1543 [Leucocoprinus birnbaumii]|uniref:Nephrocystin 3-like N-terminal domain-containing protein n=1 Tax=Leucocoprinus birnbaumii TaxID=56174 RepID=A0AAD5VZS5_9AGAR|nr:hypothetical protein NP233_g1543 [Leucocoprinus birnbaumii]
MPHPARAFFALLSHYFAQYFTPIIRIVLAFANAEVAPPAPALTATAPAVNAPPLTEAASHSADPDSCQNRESPSPSIPPRDDPQPATPSNQLPAMKAPQQPSGDIHHAAPPSSIPQHNPPLPDLSSNRLPSPHSLPTEPTRPLEPPLSAAVQPAHVDVPASQYTPSSSIPHPQSHGAFNQARDFTITNAHFTNQNTQINVSPPGSGLDKLLNHSMPDAFFNSAARHPPPRCHLGTREKYLAQITDWALGRSDHKKLVLWMHGPFGVGKSAVAQSSAEKLKKCEKLVATLFFSRSNADRDDPLRVVPSIVYQIATQCGAFADIIDVLLRKDPSLTTKSLATQFEDLLVIPLSKIDVAKEDLSGRVVIIDGLDECRGTPQQREIIKIILASVRNCTTPFRWFITSRPEEPIIQTMKSPSVSPAISSIELPVSREIDHEILLYLTDEFEKIREQHSLEEGWPPEGTLACLVDRADGLWIYVSTITRFVNDDNSFGPKRQLRLVLESTPNMSRKDGASNPLAEIDALYTLIMRQVPPNIRAMLQKILLIQKYYGVGDIATVLQLHTEEFRRCCAPIQSVMRLENSAEPTLDKMRLHFYHASFLEFLTNPERSRDLCIHGVFLTRFRAELLEWLHTVYSRTQDPSELVFPSGTVLPDGVTATDHHRYVLDLFWELCCMAGHPIDVPTATSISQLPFRKIFSLLPVVVPDGIGLDISYERIQTMRENLPAAFRDKIVRLCKCPTPGCINTENVVVLGEGENEVITPSSLDCLYWLNNQNLPSAELLPLDGDKRRSADFMNTL